MRRLPTLWTHEETAAYLRVEPDLLDRLVIAGAGPTRYWVAHHRRYDCGLVQAWLVRTAEPRLRGRHARHARRARAGLRYAAPTSGDLR